MTLATTSYHCKKCNFEASDLHTWGTREYVMPNGIRIHMKWTLGWCHVCDNICPVELLDVHRRQLELSYAQNDLKLIGSRPGPQADAQAIATWNYLAGIVEDAKDSLRLIAERKKPQHCLSCGSERVIPWQTEIDGDVRLIHGPCGQTFVANDGGIRFAIVQTIKRYTINGDLIEEATIPGYSIPDPKFHQDREQSNAKIRDLWVPTKPSNDGYTTRPWHSGF